SLRVLRVAEADTGAGAVAERLRLRLATTAERELGSERQVFPEPVHEVLEIRHEVGTVVGAADAALAPGLPLLGLSSTAIAASVVGRELERQVLERCGRLHQARGRAGGAAPARAQPGGVLRQRPDALVEVDRSVEVDVPGRSGARLRFVG